MFPEQLKKDWTLNTLGWMKDIADRVGERLAWPMTSSHRIFIEFLEQVDESLTFDEWSKQAKRLMEHHAMARNDIYDSGRYWVRFDENGHRIDEQELVSREEKDVRILLHAYRLHYKHNARTCKMCSGHLPQFCTAR